MKRNAKIKVLLVFGTRPEVIKMAPLVWAFGKAKARFDCRVCITGQHRQMADPLLKLFGIKADYDLKIMKPNQKLEHITVQVLDKVSAILEEEQFDWVLVQGDTTTAMAAALAAFYKRVKVGHVEAGLRTWDNANPYPEEANRRIIDGIADAFFAHTSWARTNLIREGFDPRRITVTGNTVTDALLASARRTYDLKNAGLGQLESERRKIITVTAHRRENAGGPLKNICAAIKYIALKYRDEVVFVYPVHMNPDIHTPVYKALSGISNCLLVKPLDYLPFVHLMKKSYFLLTDSGGLQEEAPSLGKPVLVMRKTTERPEGVKAGCVRIVGTQQTALVKAMEELLRKPAVYRRMARTRNPYGDGKAAARITAWLRSHS